MNFDIQHEGFVTATISALDALDHFMRAKDKLNTRRVLNRLLGNCLPHIRKQQLTDAYDLEKKLKAVFERLEKESEPGEYMDILAQLRDALNSALLRTP
jgi:uncharacterized protein (DUF2267 family)